MVASSSETVPEIRTTGFVVAIKHAGCPASSTSAIAEAVFYAIEEPADFRLANAAASADAVLMD